MKKVVVAFIMLCAAFSAQADELRVIPYPASLDTKSEGASSAPASINHADSPYFDTKTDYFTAQPTDSRIILAHYPTYQQTTEYTCGPAAALTVLYYFGVKDYDEMSLVKECNTRPYPIGTDFVDMLAFFKRLGWKVDSTLTHSKFEGYESFAEFVKDTLKAGTPILIDNVEWGGHWRVIIGFDAMNAESTLDDVLIMADPYDTCDHRQDGYTVENAEKFYSMWFTRSDRNEEHSEHLFITARP